MSTAKYMAVCTFTAPVTRTNDDQITTTSAHELSPDKIAAAKANEARRNARIGNGFINAGKTSTPSSS